MTRRNLFAFALFSTALALALAASAGSAQPLKAEPIRIGMAKTFFNDVPKVLVEIAIEPFPDLMKRSTGLDGVLTTDDDATDLAQKMNDGKIQLGVFHGHELAWAQQKYPTLVPFMIVSNKLHDVRAFVVVHKNCSAKSIADLRGTKMDVPLGTKQHCRVYLDRHCTDNAQNGFFSQTVKSKSSMLALDDVCRGNCQAALVDTLSLDFYRSVKGPVFDKNLRVLQQSDAFPQAVIAYKEGSLTPALLKRFRDGLQNAHKLPESDDLFKMWSIDSFDPIPNTYPHSLTETLKAYPAPAVTKVSLR